MNQARYVADRGIQKEKFRHFISYERLCVCACVCEIKTVGTEKMTPFLELKEEK